MYTKKIKRGEKVYSYYYHNVKEHGRVKNIYLGNKKKEALERLSKIKEDISNLKGDLNKESYFLRNSLIILLFLILGVSVFYFKPDLTGFITYSSSSINLDVNKEVNENALVYVNVFGQEKSKLVKEITKFENENEFIKKLNVNIQEFSFSLDPGTYNFTVSLVDNLTLLSITNEQITVEDTNQEVTNPIIINNDVEIELQNKDKVRVLLRKNKEINKLTLEDLDKLNESNKIIFVKDSKLSKAKDDAKREKVKLSEADNVENIINTNTVLDVKQSTSEFESVEVSKDELEKLKLSKDIDEVILDKEVNLLTVKSMNLTSINKVKDLGYTGTGKKVCVIDTGIDYNALGLNLGTNVFGKDFVNNDEDPLDDNGHGTSVSGILLNVAPNSMIYSAKVINANGIGYESDVLAGMEYCTQNSVDVISISIGIGLSYV